MPIAPSLDAAALPIREGLAAELKRAWARLAAPGTWWDAAERLAMPTVRQSLFVAGTYCAGAGLRISAARTFSAV